MRRDLSQATPSLSGFVLLLALRGRTQGLGHHTVLFPDDYVTAFNHGMALHKAGEYSAAADQFRRAIELNPEDASFQVALANSYERLQDRAGAAAAYAEYLRLAPDSPDVDKVRARIAVLSGAPRQP